VFLGQKDSKIQGNSGETGQLLGRAKERPAKALRVSGVFSTCGTAPAQNPCSHLVRTILAREAMGRLRHEHLSQGS
jgi:hypothetical protein